jgi:hypothetical protein
VTKRIFLLLYALLLLITASFAWIINRDPFRARNVLVDFTESGKLTVSDKNIEMSIWIANEKGEYREISNSSWESSDELFTVENIVPDHNVPFQIRLKNTSEDVLDINISVAKMICSDKLVGESGADAKVYFSTMPGRKYKTYTSIKLPEEQYFPLTRDRIITTGENQYSLAFYNSLQVPPTGVDDYVELDCRIYFDSSMDNTYQNQEFRIVTFKVIE